MRCRVVATGLLTAGFLAGAVDARAQLTATLVPAGPDSTTVALSYHRHDAATGRPYGSFTVDFSYPAAWTPATHGGAVTGCLGDVPAHIDLPRCLETGSTGIRLTLADLHRDTPFPDVADLGAITFMGTGGSSDAGSFGIMVIDARDDADTRDEANFQTQVVGGNQQSPPSPDGNQAIPVFMPVGAALLVLLLLLRGMTAIIHH